MYTKDKDVTHEMPKMRLENLKTKGLSQYLWSSGTTKLALGSMVYQNSFEHNDCTHTHTHLSHIGASRRVAIPAIFEHLLKLLRPAGIKLWSLSPNLQQYAPAENNTITAAATTAAAGAATGDTSTGA